MLHCHRREHGIKARRTLGQTLSQSRETLGKRLWSWCLLLAHPQFIAAPLWPRPLVLRANKPLLRIASLKRPRCGAPTPGSRWPATPTPPAAGQAPHHCGCCNCRPPGHPRATAVITDAVLIELGTAGHHDQVRGLRIAALHRRHNLGQRLREGRCPQHRLLPGLNAGHRSAPRHHPTGENAAFGNNASSCSQPRASSKASRGSSGAR